MADISKKTSKHPVYREAKQAGVPPIIGSNQSKYESSRGKISLISLPDYFRDGETLWEIYCLEGDLFEDIERYDSMKEAEERINYLLQNWIGKLRIKLKRCLEWIY